MYPVQPRPLTREALKSFIDIEAPSESVNRAYADTRATLEQRSDPEDIQAIRTVMAGGRGSLPHLPGDTGMAFAPCRGSVSTGRQVDRAATNSKERWPCKRNTRPCSIYFTRATVPGCRRAPGPQHRAQCDDWKRWHCGCRRSRRAERILVIFVTPSDPGSPPWHRRREPIVHIRYCRIGGGPAGLMAALSAARIAQRRSCLIGFPILTDHCGSCGPARTLALLTEYGVDPLAIGAALRLAARAHVGSKIAPMERQCTDRAHRTAALGMRYA